MRNEGRGLKIGLDDMASEVDPDTQSRIVSPAMRRRLRYVASGFPALKDFAVVGKSVCHTKTVNGIF